MPYKSLQKDCFILFTKFFLMLLPATFNSH